MPKETVAEVIARKAKDRRIGQHLSGESRCPHCGVAHPVLAQKWHSKGLVPRATSGPTQIWAAYSCTACGGVLLAKGQDNDPTANAVVAEVIPSAKVAHEDVPDVARRFLQQAYDTLHSPDAAAVMAGSAVDAMLKVLGYTKGTVYERIDEAVKNGVLTKAMGEWAHAVRLGANRPRHADKDRPHVSPEEAKQSVEFAEALGTFLFVLSKRIERGRAAAAASIC